MRMFAAATFFILHSPFFISCSEEEGAQEEYANWQARNEQFFLTLQDSLRLNPQQWQRFKLFSADPSIESQPTDYIYVKTLRTSSQAEALRAATGQEGMTGSPLYTDSVRVAYRGRLIPSVTYPQGFTFDQTYVGSYSRSTTATATFVASSLVDGFTTALMQMHSCDRWLVYIPYQLGYGTTAQTDIPAYSTLVFDIDLFSFSRADQPLQPWKVPERR